MGHSGLQSSKPSILPFYFCQLAAYRDKSPAPDACGTWPALRDAQSHALTLPGTGMAVLTDAGEARDIHPLDKRTPGTRLAKLALQQIYGQNIAVESPTALHAQKNNHTVTVQFSGCQSGLTVHALPEYHYLKRSGNQRKKLLRNSQAAQVEGFALAGADGKWYWADRAEISGDRSVTVSSDRVADPVKIRFGWMDNPTVNLYNRAGFPAIPFELSVK